MALGGTYDTGTINVSANGTIVTGAGTLWTSIAEQGDWLWANGHIAIIESIGLDTELTLYDPWTGGDLTDAGYRIIKLSWLRYDPALTQAKLRAVMAALEAPTVIFFVEGEEPDPGLGVDNQYALKSNVGAWKLWYKKLGTWVLQGTPIGIQWLGAWNAGTEYTANTAVSRLGSSFVSKTNNINKPPESNPIDWDLSTARGTDGLDGVDGADGNCGGISVRYVFEGTSQADSDPGDGKLRLGQVVQSTTTVIRADLLDAGGVNVAAVLDQLDASTSSVKAQVRLMKEFDPTRFLDFNLTGCTAAVGYRNLSVAPIAASAASPFANEELLILSVARIGDKGDQGLQGQGVDPDATGSLADRAVYDNELRGFVFLRTDSTPLELYIKASGASGDWTVASPLGNASLNSPAFTGTPTAPTAAAGTNTMQISTTAFVQAAIDVVLGGVSAAFDTLAEIATALSTKVIAPGTNTTNRVPRWNGANTKTLSDGLDVGTAANNLVQLDGFAKLPAVDGSQLTNMPSAFTTGDAKLTYKMVADPGWVLLNDGSIGNAGSGASTRANGDTLALFTLLYPLPLQMFDSAGTPIGRGANAATDFAANRRLALPTALGRSIAVAGAGAGLTPRTLGTSAGSETETPTIAKTATHTHGPGAGSIFIHNNNETGMSDTGGPYYRGTAPASTTANQGGGAPLNIVDPTTYMNVMVKL
jgi:hypothetical protein